MEKGLFINGVYESVLEEIIKSQENNPGMIFYLQPYSQSPIKQLEDFPPGPESPIPLYLSTTDNLNQICYVAEIVGWENKNNLSQKRLALLNNHMKKHQPNEEEIYFTIKNKNCVNLISIINLKKLQNKLPIGNLIKLSDGRPLMNRTRSGGWSYVYPLSLTRSKKKVVEAI